MSVEPTYNPFNGYLQHLASMSGFSLSENSVQFSNVIGPGFIKNTRLEDNLYIRYYHFQAKKDLPENFLYEPLINKQGCYTVVFNLNTASLPKHATNESDSMVCLYHHALIPPAYFKKGTNVRLLLMVLNDAWLHEYFPEAKLKVEGFGLQGKSNHSDLLYAESMDTQTRFIATQLGNELDKSTPTHMHVKTAAFILLNDFLNKMVERNKKEIISDRTLHYYTMMKVEERIMNSITNKLPNLDQLAAEFNISLSTLKRHFRIVFGKNIYQYYQEKRMEWGKVQLEKGNSSIGEIATHLGFYKINNFSIAFKKHFGILPRELKHKNFIDIQH